MDNITLIIITSVTTILGLVNIFQWFDRRSKNKALQSFLEATYNIAERLSNLSDRSATKEKSADICDILEAAILTVGGQNNKKKLKQLLYQEKNLKIKKKIK